MGFFLNRLGSILVNFVVYFGNLVGSFLGGDLYCRLYPRYIIYILDIAQIDSLGIGDSFGAIWG